MALSSTEPSMLQYQDAKQDVSSSTIVPRMFMVVTDAVKIIKKYC